MENCAALIYGRDDGHLDHLAPLCSLLNVPLYLTSHTLYDASLIQYSHLKSHLIAPNQISETLIEGYENLITTLPKALIEPIFMFEEMMRNKKLTTFWIPHGQSDKDNMEALGKEDHLLIYGNKMSRMLPKSVKQKAKAIGNFRYLYFNRYKKFYESLLKKHFGSFFDKPCILYAPSWESDVVHKWVESLIENKPQSHNLLIKLHPNTYAEGIGRAIVERYNRDDVVFVQDFYPIYPLLSKIEMLYTDISSIGYDFLMFDKPLFFTCPANDPLHRCGECVDISRPYHVAESDGFEKQRQEAALDAFGPLVKKLNV